MREETCCHHIGYSFQLAARVLLYASSHRQDNTYHGLCYTSRGTLAGTSNSSMGPPCRIDLMTHCTMSKRSYHGATSLSAMHQMPIMPLKYECVHLILDPLLLIRKSSPCGSSRFPLSLSEWSFTIYISNTI